MIIVWTILKTKIKTISHLNFCCFTKLQTHSAPLDRIASSKFAILPLQQFIFAGSQDWTFAPDKKRLISTVISAQGESPNTHIRILLLPTHREELWECEQHKECHTVVHLLHRIFLQLGLFNRLFPCVWWLIAMGFVCGRRMRSMCNHVGKCNTSSTRSKV